MFLSHRSIFVVIWDINPNHKNDTTGKIGREEALRELYEWLVMLQAHVGGSSNNNDLICFIVGNKCDLAVDDNDILQNRIIQVNE